MKLHLGSGNQYKEGWVNVDLYSDKVDLRIDLNKTLPFKDGTVDEVYCSHTLEHLNDPQKYMEELYRICKNGAKVTIKVPHFSSMFDASPFHMWSFCSSSIKFFLGGHVEKYGETKFRLVSTRIHWYPRDAWYNTTITRKIASTIGSILDILINANRHFFERIWCYWVGGAYEIKWGLEVLK